MSKSNQLTEALGYNTKRMLFSKPVVGNIPGQPQLSYQRVNITTRNPDGTSGDLIIPTEELWSFGVQENKAMGSDKISGYVLPLCLYNRDGPTEAEKAFVTTINNIVEEIKEHIFENRDEIGKGDMVKSDLRKLNPIYIKKDEKKKPVEGATPILYAKLIISKKDKKDKNKKEVETTPSDPTIKIITMFYDKNTEEEIDALSLLNVACKVQGAIKIESIFIGKEVSIQVKVYEANVELVGSANKRLLKASRPTTASSEVQDLSDMTNHRALTDMGDDNESDAGSIPETKASSSKMDIEDDAEEESVPAPAPVIKKTIKKVIKKKAVEA